MKYEEELNKAIAAIKAVKFDVMCRGENQKKAVCKLDEAETLVKQAKKLLRDL